MSKVFAPHLTDVIRILRAAHTKHDREQRRAADARGVELALADLTAAGAPATQLAALKQVRDGTKKLDDLRVEMEDVFYVVLDHRGGADGVDILWEFVRSLLRKWLDVKAEDDSFVEYNWEKFDGYTMGLELGYSDSTSEFHPAIAQLHNKGYTPRLIGEVKAFCDEHGVDFDGLRALGSELGDQVEAPTPPPSSAAVIPLADRPDTNSEAVDPNTPRITAPEIAKKVKKHPKTILRAFVKANIAPIIKGGDGKEHVFAWDDGRKVVRDKWGLDIGPWIRPKN